MHCAFIIQGAVILALIEGVIIGLNRAASEQFKPGGCKAYCCAFCRVYCFINILLLKTIYAHVHISLQ